jgi:hypothetical protein
MAEMRSLTEKELESMSPKKKKVSTSIPPVPNFPSIHHWQAAYTAGNSTHASRYDGEKILPEDWEVSDMPDIKALADQHYDKLYPPFEPDVICTPAKDYYLPALKVLKRSGGRYFSPQKESEWKDMELVARCEKDSGPWLGGRMKYVQLPNGCIDIVVDGDVDYVHPPKHEAPDSECDCGIYGSVNMDELLGYFQPSGAEVYARMVLGRYDTDHSRNEGVALCIIEPSPDAKVILCRKGWKASKAFISEIVDETMSTDDASTLLSIAWHRPMNIRRLYENR